MKRIIALLLCVGIFVVAAAGCTGKSTKKAVATGDEAISTNAADYENNFKGLCTYLSALGYINPKEKNKGITYSVMDAEIIGASEGRRFVAQHTKNTVIEIYEYDLQALQSTPDEAATDVRASVQKDNTFVNLVGETVKDAYLSDNGRFLMIYSGNDDSKEEVINNFKSFHANDK